MSWRRHTTRVFCYLNWKSLIEVWIAVLTLTTHIAAAHRSSAYYDFSIFVFNFIHDSLSIEKINVFIYASTEHVYFSHYDLSREKKSSAETQSMANIFYAEPVSNTGEMKGVLWLYLDFFTYFSTQHCWLSQICTRTLLWSFQKKYFVVYHIFQECL